MIESRHHTIFALSTPPGRSAIAVLRLTGPDCVNIIKNMSHFFKPQPRLAQYLTLYDKDQSQILDKALVLYFKNPQSFTGEDMVELHLHGSPAIIKNMTAYLSRQKYVRCAEPGEFTKRAFYNEKLDLTEVDGLSLLLQSETEHQRRLALRQMSGENAQQIEFWREQLIEILAFLEADIDFVDGEIPESNISLIVKKIEHLKEDIKSALTTYKTGSRIKDGITIAIMGSPNVGKSTLINKLAKRDVAIVSDIAGTTRDVIEVHLEIKGFPVVFYDTAGLCETKDDIEKQGIEKALKLQESADFIIQLDSCSEKSIHFEVSDDRVIKVLNKIDLLDNVTNLTSYDVSISLKEDVGVESLLDVLTEKINDNFTISSSLILTHQRQYDLLSNVLKSIDLFDQVDFVELKAEALREALTCLGRIVGKIDVEEILGKIFSSFCIGK